MQKFKNKRVLIFGLGLLGGGINTVKWFYKNGARLRITDLKSKETLKPSLKKLKNIKAKYILGKHRKEDIDWADIIVFNPGVSFKNEFVQYALKNKKTVENDCSLFFKYAQGEIIAITGTRGKTTTTTWTHKLLKNTISSKKKKIFLGGNQPNKSLLKLLDKGKNDSLYIVELSSFQLEFYYQNIAEPKIAAITNILNDHLNRYNNLQEYASIKAKIFQNQKEDDYLILNFDNEWTKFFLSLKPRSQVYYVSLNKLPSRLKGIFIEKRKLYLKDEEIFYIMNIKNFEEKFGQHNLYNLMFSFLISYLYLKKEFDLELSLKKLKAFIKNLKTPQFREEIIYQDKKLMIVNDSANTTPDATFAAIKRFYKKNINFILIVGGTDKNLDFKLLAEEICKKIKKENLILLNGSATQKLINELRKIGFKIDENNIFEDLNTCLKKAFGYIQKGKRNIILFSPAAASFEKFKNEFDRGKKFNQTIKKILKIYRK